MTPLRCAQPSFRRMHEVSSVSGRETGEIGETLCFLFFCLGGGEPGGGAVGGAVKRVGDLRQERDGDGRGPPRRGRGWGGGWRGQGGQAAARRAARRRHPARDPPPPDAAAPGPLPGEATDADGTQRVTSRPRAGPHVPLHCRRACTQLAGSPVPLGWQY